MSQYKILFWMPGVSVIEIPEKEYILITFDTKSKTLLTVESFYVEDEAIQRAMKISGETD